MISDQYTAIGIGIAITGRTLYVTQNFARYRCGYDEVDIQSMLSICRPPQPDSGKYTAIATGDKYSCAIRADKTIACWGDDYQSVTCYQDDDQTVSPQLRGQCVDDENVGGADQYTAISASPRHSCAIAADGTIACWGSDDHGQTEAPAGQYTAILSRRAAFLRPTHRPNHQLLGQQPPRPNRGTRRPTHRHRRRL